MLWDEAQKRRAREQRLRLGERYRATVDAILQAAVSSHLAKPVGAWRQPGYVDVPEVQVIRTPETRDRTLAKLGAMFPGIVKRPA